MAEIFDPTIGNLESAMARTVKIQETIAQNIANAQTPGYIPKVFDEELNKAVERQDRDSVRLEEEMAEMSKNNIRNSAYVKLLTQKLGMLRTIVTQGRK